MDQKEIDRLVLGLEAYDELKLSVEAKLNADFETVSGKIATLGVDGMGGIGSLTSLPVMLLAAPVTVPTAAVALLTVDTVRYAKRKLDQKKIKEDGIDELLPDQFKRDFYRSVANCVPDMNETPDLQDLQGKNWIALVDKAHKILEDNARPVSQGQSQGVSFG